MFTSGYFDEQFRTPFIINLIAVWISLVAYQRRRYPCSSCRFQGLQWIHGSALWYHGYLTGAKSFTLKISQFGHVSFQKAMIYGNRMTTKVAIVSANRDLWTAPEVLRQETLRDRKSDIYSFGIIVNEICSKALPFSHIPDFDTEGIACCVIFCMSGWHGRIRKPYFGIFSVTKYETKITGQKPRQKIILWYVASHIYRFRFWLCQVLSNVTGKLVQRLERIQRQI